MRNRGIIILISVIATIFVIMGIFGFLLLNGWFKDLPISGVFGVRNEASSMNVSNLGANSDTSGEGAVNELELTITNDWTGTNEHGNGIWRVPYITQSDISLSSSMPPGIDYTVEAFEIADMTAETEEMAEYLSIPLQTTVTFVQTKITFYNVYGHNFYFYPNRAVLTINGEKSYPCREELCQGMGNLYRQRAMKSGEIYFILEDMPKKDILEASLTISAPTSKENGNGDKIGNDARILFHINQERTNVIHGR